MEDEFVLVNIVSPAHFVLVHGACHGGWCWYKVRCLLESIGHKVSSPDLSCSGIEPSDPNTMFTFQEYNKPLHDMIANLPPGEKVILVGHSIGGYNITEVLQSYPHKIQAAVYVAAAMLPNGNQTEKDRKYVMLDLPGKEVFDFTYGEGPDKPPTSAIFKKKFQRQYLYNMSPLEDCTLAGMLLRPTPVRATGDAEFPDGKGSDKVPRVYIRTLNDNLMSLERHEEFIKKWPPSEVYDIESDHCAMISNPTQLFGLLVKVATKWH
ncbi:methylesterase 17-like [Chenopodium quinoa]|uniref:methylesterase 17-like n=1 Tax=Chenopodium quinoa TaxID=63459 RepID=UPI000B782D67|nr:methylesterase 17-like [Chenopodium quinoa]XP_021758257.1 methylesterase 17-like [Chenopodium quinoa]